MSTVSNLIFNNVHHYITSNFGKRGSTYHNAVDYGTDGKKIPQYAIADGVIDSCGVDKAYDDAIFVWVSYESLGVRMLHYHLDRYDVKAGDTVTKGTVIGYTGNTGNSTGIHLHLGLKEIGKNNWMDVEAWSKNVYDKIYLGKDTTPTVSNDPSKTKPTYTAEPQKIWEYFIVKIKNPYGVAGLLANIFHESSCIAANVQNSYESKKITDTLYTSAVDSGARSRDSFIKDKIGYGLAQWTHESRKQKFYDFYKERKASTGVSIGNLYMQLDFLYKELTTGYKGVLEVLKKATTVKEASNKVLLDFEAPKNKGAEVQNNRKKTAEGYFNKYKNITAESLEKQTTDAEVSGTIEENEEPTITFTIEWLAIGNVDED